MFNTTTKGFYVFRSIRDEQLSQIVIGLAQLQVRGYFSSLVRLTVQHCRMIASPEKFAYLFQTNIS